MKTSAIALSMLLGIGSVGCGDEDKDTSGEDTATEEPASEPDGCGVWCSSSRRYPFFRSIRQDMVKTCLDNRRVVDKVM